MHEGVRYALSEAWWSWDAAVVRRALWSSVLSRFRMAAVEAFRRNRTDGRHPRSWKDMELLRRQPRTIERVMSGDHNLCLEFLLGSAAVLGLNTREFFPETSEWIGEATVYLSAPKFGGVFTVPAADARTYAQWILPVVAGGPCRTREALRNRLDAMATPDRAVVERVASSIAPVLTGIAPKT